MPCLFAMMTMLMVVMMMMVWMRKKRVSEQEKRVRDGVRDGRGREGERNNV